MHIRHKRKGEQDRKQVKLQKQYRAKASLLKYNRIRSVGQWTEATALKNSLVASSIAMAEEITNVLHFL